MNLKKILSLPKSLYFNLKVFPLKTAIKLPILISYDTKIINIHKGSIIINSSIKPQMIQIGFGGIDYIPNNRPSFLRIDNGGKIIFNGTCQISSGSSIRISKNGILDIGTNFSSNKNLILSCDDLIKIGNNVLLGWNVNIRTGDGHYIYDLTTNIKNPITKSVVIGNHVWIASYVHILKGSVIKDNCVLAYNSCTMTNFNETNCIIGGYPAKILRRNINWHI